MDSNLKNAIVHSVKATLSPATDIRGQHAFTSQEVDAIAKAIAKAFEIYDQSKK